MKKYAFGVDVGGTTCKIGFFTVDGELLEKWEIPTDTKNNGAKILLNIANEIDRKLEKESIDRDELLGIGIGVPGPVTGNSVVSVCENLGWENVNVAADLTALTGLVVKAENDANLAALGEMWKGNAAGSKNMMLVTLGTGVGAGVIVDGQVIAGARGAAGEIGHMVVCFEEQEMCACGKYGCLEQYGSATGIVRLAKRRLQKLKNTDGAHDTNLSKKAVLTAKAVFDAAKAGDIVALETVDEAGRILGAALANVACVTNPEVIVIGGGVSKAGSILTDVIQKNFTIHAFTDCRDARFVLASLGNDAGIYGGVKLLQQ
ncbi:MAG: ROK family glucokinase [Lachnospiraceae bacterium]|nr:ROK family glucokinase [Lachnospiraceae bacterium]